MLSLKQPEFITKDVRRKLKRKIVKNIFLISLAWSFLFTAFRPVVALQSSLNMKEGLGTAGLAVLYGGLVLACLFLSSMVIRSFGCKKSIIVSMVGYVIYIVCNFWQSWYTVIPGSFICGVSAGPLWAAKSCYISQASRSYSQISKESKNEVTARFFGYFFFFHQSSTIFGNVLSSSILMTGERSNASENNISMCGFNNCHNDNNNTNLMRPSDSQLYLLFGVFLALALIAMILVSFMDDLKEESDIEVKKFDHRNLVATFKQMNNKYQLLLIPITMYCGVGQAFINSDFTKGYVGCALGISMIGIVHIFYGICDAVSCVLSGKLSKHIHRVLQLFSGGLIHVGCLILLTFWKPGNSSSQLPIYFLNAGMWGIGESIFLTQIFTFYGVVFRGNNDAAFSNRGLWESIGFVIAFSCSSNLCMNKKIYLYLTVIICSLTFYGITEILIEKNRRQMEMSVNEELKRQDPKLETNALTETMNELHEL